MTTKATTHNLTQSYAYSAMAFYWLFFTIAGGVLAALLAMGLLLAAHPYDGVITHCCDGIVRRVEPDSPVAGQIAAGDQITRINGLPLVIAFRHYATHKVGDTIIYTLDKEEQQVEASVQLIAPPLYEQFRRLEPLFIGVGFWLISLLAWLVRPLSPVVRLFFGAMQLSALLLSIGSMANLHIWWAVPLFNLLALLAPVFIFHFLWRFPLPLTTPHQRAYLYAVYGVALGLCSAYLWVIVLRADFSGHYGLDPIRDGFIVLVTLGALLLLSRSYHAAPLHIRQRRRLIIAGIMLAICPTLFLYFIPQALRGTPLVSYLWTFPLALLLPLSVLYAIYAGELGRVDRFLNRSLVYTLLTALLLGLYLLFFWASRQQLWVGYLWNSPLGNAGLTALVALLYTPTRKQIQQQVDQLFYGGWYSYRTVVRSASHQLSQELDLDQLAQRLMTVMRMMRFQSAALFWAEQTHFALKASYGYQESTQAQLCLPVDSALIKLLRRTQLPVLRPGQLAHQWSKVLLNSQEQHFLANHEIKFWLPLVNRNTLCALLVMGERAGEELLDDEDEDVLATVAQQVTLAAENISLVAALRTRLAEVERMRDELAETQKRLADAREAERQHLSRELHDGPVQDLYSIQIQLQMLKSQLSDQQTLPTIDAMQSALQQITNTLRDMMNALRPPALSAFGLAKAIGSHVDHLQQKQGDLVIHANLMNDGQLLAEPCRLALFRVVQESLNNIVRHAQAQTVFITFRFDQQRVHLEIQDDGCGFNVPDRWIDFARQGHWGLLGMAERVEAIGGHFQVASLPGAGTRLQVTVPLTSSAIEA